MSETVEELETTGLSVYDKAMKAKLLEVFDNVISAPPEEAFTRSNKNGKVPLPMISFFRMSNQLESDINHSELFYGNPIKNDGDKVLLMEGLPITIVYQIDVWAQLRAYADGIFRELIYYLFRDPNLYVKIPEFNHDLIFALQYQDMDQPTDYESFTDKFQIHRYTLNFEVPRARLFYPHNSAKIVKSIPITLIDGGNLLLSTNIKKDN